jgi:hypothetical protein
MTATVRAACLMIALLGSARADSVDEAQKLYAEGSTKAA